MVCPKEFIGNKKKSQLKSDIGILDSLTGAIEKIEKAFPKYGSFLMEFLQNADDAKASSLRISVDEEKIYISNDGAPFSEKDVNSICSVGRSSKTPEDYIGYLGVGFKAVFLISDSPSIYSGDFRFKFDRYAWDNPEHIPWQIMPIWIESPYPTIPSGYTTLFELPPKNREMMEQVRKELRPYGLNNRILLFLRNIHKIEITDKSHRHFRRSIEMQKIISELPDYEIYEIREDRTNKGKIKERWLTFRSVCNVPQEVREDYTTKDWDRGEIDKREIVAAFRIDDKWNLMKEERGTAHIGVFSFLPLKDIPSGLNFLIQADFLTTPGRSELSRDAPWNHWLADEIYKLLTEKCIPAFKENEKWGLNFSDILYPKEGGHDLFEEHIKKPLRKYLEKEPVLKAADGSFIRAADALKVDPAIKSIIPNAESIFEELYPEKKLLAYESNAEQLNVTEDIYFRSQLTEKEMELMKIMAEKREINFFKYVYSRQGSKYAKSTLKNYRSQKKILTSKWTLESSTEVYLNSQGLVIPQEVEDKINIVHPALIEDEKVLVFLEKLNINELTEEIIEDLISEMEIPNMKENWENFSETQKIQKLEVCKKLWERGEVEDVKLDFLTLKTKSGDWLNPEEIIFSEEYMPKHKMEQLVKKGLYDLPLNDKPITFLSDVFITNKSETEIQSWRKFFESLGTDKLFSRHKSKITERVAIRATLAYEQAKGRAARELNESEKMGYDVESGERYIEVKGSKDPSPSISITSHEMKVLSENPEKYFVYIVKETLTSPSLHVIRGNKLIEKLNRVNINFDAIIADIEDVFNLL